MNTSQWSIWLANLDPVVGSEQGRTRPVLVISDTSLNNILPVVNVIPITSRKPKRRVYPNEVVGISNFGLRISKLNAKAADLRGLTRMEGKVISDKSRGYRSIFDSRSPHLNSR